MSPLFLSSSYLVFEPFGTSMTTGTMSGARSPSATSCHGCILEVYPERGWWVGRERRISFGAATLCLGNCTVASGFVQRVAQAKSSDELSRSLHHHRSFAAARLRINCGGRNRAPV